jgi:hypothetical protein
MAAAPLLTAMPTAIKQHKPTSPPHCFNRKFNPTPTNPLLTPKPVTSHHNNSHETSPLHSSQSSIPSVPQCWRRRRNLEKRREFSKASMAEDKPKRKK